MRGGKAPRIAMGHRSAVTEPPIGRFLPNLRFRKTRVQNKEKRVIWSGVVTLTLEIFHPFMGNVNPRVSLSCLVDGNGKASQTLKADAGIDEGKSGEFTQHHQRRDEIVFHPRIGADVEFGQRPS